MMFGVGALTRKVESGLAEISRRIQALEGMAYHMATRAEIEALKAQLMTAITDAANRVTTDIQALRDALAAGTPISDQDLADLQSDITAVGAIDPPTPPASR